MRFNRALMAGVGCAMAAAGHAATITVYDADFAGWSAAVVSWHTETFTGNVLTQAGNGLSVTSTVGSIGGTVGSASGADKWNDRLTGSGGESTKWHFACTATAFGGTWDLSPGGPGHGLDLNITLTLGGGVVFAGTIAPTTSSAFWGFTSDMAFDCVEITAGPHSAIAETYSMDDLVFNSVCIPLPTGAGLGTAGLFLLTMRRRRSA